MRDKLDPFSDDRLPPGCRQRDFDRERGLEDLSPEELWELLEERQQSRLHREFFHQEWGELSARLEEPAADQAIGELWRRWRDRAVLRLLQGGEIHARRQ